VQARTLLAGVRETKRSEPQLVAFFGLMYFGGLRPEEAANLRNTTLRYRSKAGGAVPRRDHPARRLGPRDADHPRQLRLLLYCGLSGSISPIPNKRGYAATGAELCNHRPRPDYSLKSRGRKDRDSQNHQAVAAEFGRRPG